MDAAVKAAKEGAEDARTTAADALPAVGQMASRLVYNTCYAISYGVVFPTVLAARSIPKDNAAVHGLIDGAHAAVDMVHEMKPKRVSKGTQESATEEHAGDDASQSAGS
jgi:hypothetical protein